MVYHAETAILSYEISQYPDKVTYIAGVDTQLDISGGRLNGRLSSNGKREIGMPIEGVTHDIDFSTPGVYVVTITLRGYPPMKFPIQVISEDFVGKINSE